MNTIEEFNYMNSKIHDGGKKKVVVNKTPKKVKDPTTETETPSNNLINITDTYRFIDLYFKQKNIMYSHLYNSFDKLLDEDIPNFLKNNNNTFFEKVTADKIYRYKFKFENIAIKPPFIDIDDEIMFPQHARLRNLTYSSKLIATITQIQEITDIATGEITEKIVGTPEHAYPITDIPILVRSKYCSLNLKKGYDKSECGYDPGGYFIVNGSEKVVMSLERMIENRPLVFIKKDASVVNYKVQVNSKSYKTDMMQQVTITMKKDMNMSIKIQILNDVPVFILMKALGIESDKDIINYCVYDHNDIDMINIVRLSLENAKEVKDKKITTQLDALNYLTTHLKVYKKYNETEKDTKQKEKRLHLTQLLKDSFLIHMPGNFTEKAYYIGFMINRLLQCFLGRIPPDDRDNYINKRVDLPGQLMMDLIKQYYKKMLNECNKFFKRKNSDDEKPLNIINQIKPTIIKQGLTTALLTGAWNKKKGVAQMLQRLTPLQTFSSLRRINSPTVDASTNKLTSPRHLHNSLIGPICVSGDTEILLDDGVTVKQIKEMTNNDRVITVNKEDLSLEPSKIRDKFMKMPDKLLKITTISGREIKCTPEHPLLIKNHSKYEMIEACKLKKCDLVIIKHTQKYLPIDKETKFMIKSDSVDEQYKLELLKLNLLDRNFTQNELEIMARLLGANITDGHIHNRDKYYDCAFCVGEIEDAYDLVDDIMRLGFGSPCVQRQTTHYKDISRGKNVEYKTIAVNKNGVFAYFMSLIGAFIGNKTQIIKKIPDWIKDGNRRIIREFLSGFQGGDGSRICAQKQKGGYHKLRIHETQQTTIKEQLENSIEFMNSISTLFSKFDIINSVKHNQSKNDENKYIITLDFSNTITNLNKYVDYIGYRYCHEKQRKSALAIEYVKCKQYLSRTRMIDYDDFAKKYMLKNDIVSMSIDKIEEVPVEQVYDFTTISDNHSFIANGIVSSNCFIETSEGAKVGLVKNLSMIGNITVMKNSIMDDIKKIVKPKVYNIQDISSNIFQKYTRVMINGEIIGLTDKPYELYRELKQMKYDGTFDPQTSITLDIRTEFECKDLRISCDTGRMFHPTIRVENNNILLSKEMIDSIGIDEKESTTKVTSWNQFMMKYPGVIEYIDTDEKSNAMIAMLHTDVEKEKTKMVNSVELLKKLKESDFKNIINRYDQFTYVKYTHCEIHPSLLIGLVVANIPFLECNQGPRNIFQYSQARQAMGIYATNWRDRLDISYILYHPQRPIVTTRAMKYINTEKMPAGENCIVAISVYSG